MSRSPSDWIGYWDGAPTVYAGDRHKAAHYRAIAADIASHVTGPEARVLDYGCGEALSADRVAARCGRLYLVDAAPSVRAGLSARFAAVPGITVMAPDDLGAPAAGVGEGSLDLIVVNSVIQYMSPEALDEAVRGWLRLLAPGGALLIADVIPPDQSAAADALALLAFARREGFFGPAVLGLVRTALSDYRTLRTKLGLTTYTEDQIVARLAGLGLVARRVHPNLGHNQGRIAVLARRAKGLS